jgi:hypothetical protein
VRGIAREDVLEGREGEGGEEGVVGHCETARRQEQWVNHVGSTQEEVSQISERKWERGIVRKITIKQVLQKKGRIFASENKSLLIILDSVN